MTLRGKITDINNFKTDIFDDAIEESRLDFEDTRDVKGELIKPKEFTYEKWTQWEDSIYNYFVSRKKQSWCAPILSHQKGYVKYRRQ